MHGWHNQGETGKHRDRDWRCSLSRAFGGPSHAALLSQGLLLWGMSPDELARHRPQGRGRLRTSHPTCSPDSCFSLSCSITEYLQKLCCEHSCFFLQLWDTVFHFHPPKFPRCSLCHEACPEPALAHCMSSWSPHLFSSAHSLYQSSPAHLLTIKLGSDSTYYDYYMTFSQALILSQMQHTTCDS